MEPHRIITLMRYESTSSTLPMSDHDDHIHVGFRPQAGTLGPGSLAPGDTLDRSQWLRLAGRLGSIGNPTLKPARSARRAFRG